MIKADVVVDTGVSSLIFDVTIPCCAASQYMNAGSIRDPKVTLQMAEHEKVVKYTPFLEARNISVDAFFPIVMETSGRIGDRVMALSQYIGKLDRPTIRVDTYHSAFNFFLARARTTLARSNGNMLRFSDQCRIALSSREQ